MIAQLIFTLAWTVLFCLGLRIITDEGQVLHFLRKPFDNAFSDAEVLEERQKLLQQCNGDPYLIKQLSYSIAANRLLFYIGKPVVTCITCYGSVWGFAVFSLMNSITADNVPYLIINCFSAAFLNTLIWKLYARLDI